MSLSLKKISNFILITAFLFIGIQSTKALNTTYTVCPVGCDFTTISGALAAPGLSNDIIQPTADYIFDNNTEVWNNTLSPTVSLVCLTGADVIGDQTFAIYQLFLDSNTTIDNCTFEGVNLTTNSGSGNINIINNNFIGNERSSINLDMSDGFVITGNQNINQINIGASDNGLIQNNKIVINQPFYSAITTWGVNINLPSDYGVDANIPNFIQINDNEIVNSVVSNTSDWVSIYAGKDIQLTNNKVYSSVTLDDLYITLLSFANSQLTVSNNLIIAPEKIPGAVNGTWALNVRRDTYDADIKYFNNTIILNSQQSYAPGDACFGYYDNGLGANETINIESQFNLCYHPNIDPFEGNAFALEWQPVSSNLLFSESSNGIWGFQNIINDQAGIYFTPSITDILRKPIFKDENIDTNDDYHLNPISSYLDISGNLDIGAFSDVREPNAVIDQNCIVDYVTCFSHFTSILEHTLINNDTVHIGSGTYEPIKVVEPLDNISISGSGPSTVIDGNSTLFAILLNSVGNSLIENLTVKNAVINQINYFMSSDSFSNITQDYNIPSGPIFLDTGCSAVPLSGPTDISAINGVGTSNISLFLIHIPNPPSSGDFFVVYASKALLNDPSDLLTVCGVPVSIIDQYFDSVFILNGNEYIYNNTDIVNAGFFPTGGSPDPVINSNSGNGSGILLDNAKNNTLSNILFSDNNSGIKFQNGSFQNHIKDSTFANNLINDLWSSSALDNYIENSSFDFAKTKITNTGNLEIFFNFLVNVKDGNGSPLNNVNVNIKDNNNNLITDLVTQPTGDTPLTSLIRTQILSSANPTSLTAGNLSPFKFNASFGGLSANLTQTISLPNQVISLILNNSSNNSGGGNSGGGGVGAGGPYGKQSCSGSQCESSKIEHNLQPDTDEDYFIDIKYNWARDHINNLAKKGIAKGYPDKTFKPNIGITRAEFAAFIFRNLYPEQSKNLPILKQASFPDVNIESWYNSTLQAGKEQKIIDGYADSLFRPDQIITGAEAMKIILHSQNHQQEVQKFNTDSVSKEVLPNLDRNSWYAKYILWAATQGEKPKYPDLIDKYADPITRALAAKIIDQLGN